jgi:ADP-heptose:LPS heptosyltransferase
MEMNASRRHARAAITRRSLHTEHASRRSAAAAQAVRPRILIIQLGRLGDVIQTTPLIDSLQQQDSRAQIEVLVFDSSAAALKGMDSIGVQVLHEAALPGRLSEVHARIEADREASRQVFPELLQVFEQLELAAYDSVLNCSYSPLAAWVSQRVTTKSRTGPTITAGGEVLFQHPAHVYLRARGHFRDQNWFNLVDLWRCTAGGVAPPGASARPRIVAAEDLPFAIPSGTCIALNPGSSESRRRWPARQFAALADLLARSGFHPILVGAPSDAPVCAEVHARCAATIPNFCGQTSVAQMAALLSRAELLVSNDTGAIHIASAVGCRVVGLFGASAYFAETSPWSEGNLILQGPLGHDGVYLDTELVATAAMHILRQTEEAELSRRLSAPSAFGWKTQFLPPDADAMGGLAYRPLHPGGDGVEARFTRILRNLFAGVFSGRELEFRASGSNRSISEARKPSFGSAEHAAFLAAVAPFVSSLEQMAASAARCRSLSLRPSSSKAMEISQRVDELNAAMEQLKARAESAPTVKPVVHFLDWQCRMMPPESPAQTFHLHEVEYRRAVRMLGEAASRFDTAD